MQNEPPKQVPLGPEVQGYIAGLKDIIAVQTDMVAQRAAEIFALRAQIAELLKKISAGQPPRGEVSDPE